MLIYFIQVSFCWLLFHLIYLVFLRKETFFHTNRWYLLSTLFLGFLLPLLRYYSIHLAPTPELAQVYVEPVAIGLDMVQYSVTTAQQSIFSQYVAYLWLLYLLVVLVLFGRFLYGLYRIFDLYQKATISHIKGIRLARTASTHSPFSFGNTIFWSKDLDLSSNDFSKIIQHEEGHIKGGHTFDVLVLELLSIFLWCSPPIWWYKKSLKEVHEYLADAFVLTNTETKQYGLLLLQQAQPGLQVALANHFFHSQLKNRIAMMTKSKSQKWKQWKYALGFSAFAVLLMAFSLQNNRFQFFKNHPELLGQPLSCGLNPLIENGYSPETIASILEVNLIGASGATISETGEVVRGDLESSLQVNRFHSLFRKLIQILPEHKTEIEEIAHQVADKYHLDAEFNEHTIIYKGKNTRVVPISEDDKKNITKSIREMGDLDEKTITFNEELDEGILKRINTAITEHLARFQEKENIVNEKTVEPLSILFINGKEQAADQCLNLDTHKIEDIIHLTLKESIEKYGERGKNKVVEYVAVSIDNVVHVQEPYKAVEQMPRFPADCEAESEANKTTCAQKEMLQFIYSMVKYPKVAREKGIQGITVVRFIIDKEGHLIQPEIVRSIDAAIDEEVLRVINAMPKWIPGRQNGEAVSVYFHLPVKFKLEDNVPPVEKTIASVSTQLDLKEVNLFPNPATEFVHIEFEAPKDAFQIQLVDMSGKEYYSKNVATHEGLYKERIDLTNIPKGMLLISIISGDKIFNKKIAKQ